MPDHISLVIHSYFTIWDDLSLTDSCCSVAALRSHSVLYKLKLVTLSKNILFHDFTSAKTENYKENS